MSYFGQLFTFLERLGRQRRAPLGAARRGAVLFPRPTRGAAGAGAWLFTHLRAGLPGLLLGDGFSVFPGRRDRESLRELQPVFCRVSSWGLCGFFLRRLGLRLWGRHDSAEGVSPPHIRSGVRAVTAACGGEPRPPGRGGTCRRPAWCPPSPPLGLQSGPGAQRTSRGRAGSPCGEARCFLPAPLCLQSPVGVTGGSRALSLCSGHSGFRVCACPDARRRVCLGGYRVILYICKPSWALFWGPVSLGNKVLLSGPAFRTCEAGQGLTQFWAGVPPAPTRACAGLWLLSPALPLICASWPAPGWFSAR